MMKAVKVFKLNPVSTRRNIMSEEIKRIEQELAEQELDRVAGGKTFPDRWRSKASIIGNPAPTNPSAQVLPPKTGGSNAK